METATQRLGAEILNVCNTSRLQLGQLENLLPRLRKVLLQLDEGQLAAGFKSARQAVRKARRQLQKSAA